MIMQLQLPSTADKLVKPDLLVKPDQEVLLTPEEFRALTVRLRRNAWRYMTSFLLSVFLVPIAVIVGALLSMWVGLIPAIEGLLLYGLANALLLALTIALIKADKRKNRQYADRLLQFVIHTHDVAMLGPILDLKEANEPLSNSDNVDSRIDKAADDAVLRLLPLVQASDADSLNGEQRTHLLCYIWYDADFTGTRGLDNLPYARGVLHALEHVGCKDDLPAIMRMLDIVDATPEFRASVQHCAQVVRERAAREEGKDILLRADCKPQAVATLLRHSIESADTPSYELLRATPSEHPEIK